jgi:hypothetical protein
VGSGLARVKAQKAQKALKVENKLLRGRKGVEDRFRFLAELVYLNGTSENYRIFRFPILLRIESSRQQNLLVFFVYQV